MNRPLCIYHANCADGFTAAWILHCRYMGLIDFHPGVYQDPPPDVRGRDVIFVDFSYKRPVMEEILTQAAQVFILDHHKTAIDDLQGLPFTEAIFDTERSGAGIAWEWAFPSAVMPELVRYVQDRDLWRFELSHSRDVNACIFSYDYTFDNWNALEQRCGASFGDVVREGAAIERKHHKDVAELVKVTERTMDIGGYTVPVANIPYTLTSDAGHLMAARGWPFAVCYWDTPDGRVFSLRSTDIGKDVGMIAKQYGGGGHKHAAGFRVPFDQLAEKGLL